MRRLLGLGLAALMAGGFSACGSKGSADNFMPVGAPAPVQVVVENRSFDGTANHLSEPARGSADTRLLRLLAPAYEDGMMSMAGSTRPNPRFISNTVLRQTGSIPDPAGRSGFVWAWGQFLDHDISLSETGTEVMNIQVPMGDPMFDPLSTGLAFIPAIRSSFDPTTGTDPANPRQQMNAITAFIDGSQVYSSHFNRAVVLRSFNNGRLATSAGNFLPFNELSLENANDLGADPTTLFIAGDVRANEQLALLSLHTLFMREHNRLADEIAAAQPQLGDEEIYQRARKLVGALLQVITYEEFLPALLGPEPLPPYTGYNPQVDPSIEVLFSTAAYRLGHSMVGATLFRLQADGLPIAQGHLGVRESFFQPHRLAAEGGISPILRGLAANRQERTDAKIIEDLRSFLFGPPGAGGLDLGALNIQRGRDHGLPDYNMVREQLGFGRVTSFAQISSDPNVQAELAAAYASLDSIDPWVGLLSEDPLPGSAVGPTLRAILVEQFTRLRDGDRFFYLNDPALAGQLATLRGTRLSDIIARNTQATLQPNVFFVP